MPWQPARAFSSVPEGAYAQSCRDGREKKALTHRGWEAAQWVVLPTEHHGACWELLGTAARDVLACRQGEALGGHCGDCVGQRDRSLVRLWREHQGTLERKPGYKSNLQRKSPVGGQEGLWDMKPAWSTQEVPGQPGLHRETLSQNTKKSCWAEPVS